jgi:hypothetical protein
MESLPSLYHQDIISQKGYSIYPLPQSIPHIHLLYCYLLIQHTIVRFTQYLLIGILTLAIVQMVLSSRYNIYILLATVGISYTLGTVLMVILAKRFFSWFKSNRSSVVFLYGLSSIVIAINLGFSLGYVFSILPINFGEIRTHTTFFIPYNPAGSIISALNNGYAISSIISFIVIWIATAVSATSLLFPETWANQILGDYMPSSSLFLNSIPTFIFESLLSASSIKSCFV